MLVVQGAELACSFGEGPPASLEVLREDATVGALAIATVSDMVPLVNVPSFGLCTSTANPQVMAATAAAMGALTPMPCVPVAAVPWTPGAETVLVGGVAALTDSSRCACQWGGEIQVVMAGQLNTEVAG